jgi:hypothetical protein
VTNGFQPTAPVTNGFQPTSQPATNPFQPTSQPATNPFQPTAQPATDGVTRDPPDLFLSTASDSSPTHHATVTAIAVGVAAVSTMLVGAAALVAMRKLRKASVVSDGKQTELGMLTMLNCEDPSAN